MGLPDERTTTYTRAATSNLVTSVTDPLGRQTDYTYDTKGNVTSITRLAGTVDAVSTIYTYEPTFSRIATVTDPLTHTTAFTYDTLGRLTTITDALGHETTFTYNAAGQPLTVTNDLSETVQIGYSRGEPISITNALGQSTQQYFDSVGRLSRLTDPTGASTRYEYNPLNQVTKVVDALAGETAFRYDANGNMLTLTDARGKTTTWAYDNMDRIETRTDPLARSESFTYNENAVVKTWTDRKGQVTAYTYDAHDRRTFVGFGMTGTPPIYASTITTSYDDGDRATEIVDSTAGTIERTYDLLDRLTEETTPEGTIAYTYDAAGRRETMQVTGQTVVSYSYDNAARLTGITNGTAGVAIVYDTADRRTSLTLPNGIVIEYRYDSASQLTELIYKVGGTTLGNLAYAYNAAGQRVGVAGGYARTGLPTALTAATHDDANQIATFGGTSFSHDANGNLTSDGTNTYNWNARNQMSAISGGVSASFAYDGFGRRRSKTVSGTTTQFLYDGLNPVQELASGTPTAHLLTGFSLDDYFTRTDAAGVRNYLTDALGSSVALTDGSATLQTEYTYQPFGKTTATGSATTNTFGFTGREDDGTGLHYYRARYYNSQLQRFVGEDPLGFASGDFNLFGYTANRPVDLTDPLGLCPLCVMGRLPPIAQWWRAPNQMPRPVQAPRPSPPPVPRQVHRPPPGADDLVKHTNPTDSPGFWQRVGDALDALMKNLPDDLPGVTPPMPFPCPGRKCPPPPPQCDTKALYGCWT